MNKKIVWKPKKEYIKQTNLNHFIQFVNQQYHLSLQNYAELHQWSITQISDFWASVWQFCQIKSSQPYHTAISDLDQMPGAKWFVGAKLNFAENLLSRKDEKIALVYRDEQQQRRSYTYKALYEEVSRLAAAMKAMGIQVGDRVAAYLPNLPETIIAMLATTSLGAIWSACSPDFGLQGVLDRFAQIQPKLLFAADGYCYQGQHYDSLEKIAALRAAIPSLEKVVIIPHLTTQPAITAIDDALLYSDFLLAPCPIIFEQLPFDHPVYILYSSGTTGVPKCIVHSAGGTLLQHLKELMLHTDLKPEDIITYYTTCGWMMWNWLISSLAVGATVVLYEGSPIYPRLEYLFDIVAAEKISVFGTSAKYISSLEKAHLQPGKNHDLSTLRTILSTGSPLAPESFDFVYSAIKPDIALCSISGGTDIVSCFALGCPILPIYRGELQCRGLGLDVAVYDENGQAIINTQGELVCRQPFPAMPIYFWNDPYNEKYHAAYFAKFPQVWAHGDYAKLTEHGGLVIYGRSDAVLNPGGVRIGTAEIYRQVEKIDDVLESLAVSQILQGDEKIILFVKLRPGIVLEKPLIDTIKNTIRQNATPRHIPSKIYQVEDIPRTFNGKIAELAVRNILHDLPVKNKEALLNPEVLKEYEKFRCENKKHD